MMRRPGAAHLLAGFLSAAGAAHLVVPDAYQRLIPSVLPSPKVWVYASAVAELACAAALVAPRTRRTAGWATAALFVGVFPGNLTMAADAVGRGPVYRAIAYGRLPLQVPLVWWAVAVARSAPRTGRTANPGPRSAESG